MRLVSCDTTTRVLGRIHTTWGVCLPDDSGLKAVDDETSFLHQLLSLVSVIQSPTQTPDRPLMSSV